MEEEDCFGENGFVKNGTVTPMAIDDYMRPVRSTSGAPPEEMGESNPGIFCVQVNLISS